MCSAHGVLQKTDGTIFHELQPQPYCCNFFFKFGDAYYWILCLQKSVRLSYVLFILPFYEAFSIPVKNKRYGEWHRLKFHEQSVNWMKQNLNNHFLNSWFVNIWNLNWSLFKFLWEAGARHSKKCSPGSTLKHKLFFDETLWYVNDKPCISKQNFSFLKKRQQLWRVKSSYAG